MSNSKKKKRAAAQHRGGQRRNGPWPVKKRKTWPPSSSAAAANDSPRQKQLVYEKPTIPFSPDDTILLVGEGDLSFAACLVAHHACTRVTATVLEPSPAELADKYPPAPSGRGGAAANAATVLAGGPDCTVRYGMDARRNLGPFRVDKQFHDQPQQQHRHENPNDHTADHEPPSFSSKKSKPNPEKVGKFVRIVFNFPHVGGKSTDVNRQVRHNQELLVSFFRRAEPSLAPRGAIIVTLFEGEPYTLWNVADLARHCGLQVERSFRFRSTAYPGYRHARTLGAVRDRRTGRVRAEGGAWTGADRPARSYVFVRKEEALMPGAPGSGRRKRKRTGGVVSDEEHDEDND